MLPRERTWVFITKVAIPSQKGAVKKKKGEGFEKRPPRTERAAWGKMPLLSFGKFFLCFFLKIRDLRHDVLFAHIIAETKC
jgi:hypothetical protein